MKRLRLTLAMLGLAIAFTFSACSNSGTTSAGQWIAPLVQSMEHACQKAGATKSECGCVLNYMQHNYKTGSISNQAEFQTAMETALQSCKSGS